MSALTLAACASAPLTLAGCASAPALTAAPKPNASPAAVSGSETSEAPPPVAPVSEPVQVEPAEPEPVVPETLPEFSTEEQKRIKSVQRFVHAAARKHGVDAQLINGVIWVESRFQSRAHGRLGPRGLMQLMPRTARVLARELGRRTQSYSADFNIDAGTLYLAHMLKAFRGDIRLALAAYNAGPTTVRDALDAGQPLADGVEGYVRKVLTAARVFEERGVH